MNRNALNSGKYIYKIYDKLLDKVSLKYGITSFELKILLFLKCNNECDTARDMVEKLNLNKSNVSEAIDSLTKKGYLKGFQDDRDRRYVHLKVNESASTIVKEAFRTNDEFIRTITKDIPKEKLDLFEEVLDQIVTNMVEVSKNM